MADAITGNTELLATKQTVIASIVQRELREAIRFRPVVRDVSNFAVKGARQISFPKLGSFTVTNRASATAGDATVLTSTVDTMDLAFNAYISYIIDPTDEIQSTIDAQAEFAARAATAHGRYVDTQIIAELETVGVPTATAGAISRDIFLEMQTALMERNANMDQVMFVCSPAQRANLLRIQQFADADVYGQAVVPSGQIASIYGTPIMYSNLLSTDQYFMFDSDGIALGIQLGPNMSEQMENQYGSQAIRVAMDVKFGTQGLQLGENGVTAVQSALVVKDGN